MLRQNALLFLRDRLQAASRCPKVICSGSTTSEPTQPQGEEVDAPGIALRFNLSPGKSPFCGEYAFLLRFGGIKTDAVADVVVDR